LPAIERYIGKKIPSETASAELYADDKSAGQHIRTEFYEDRSDERRPAHGRHGGARAGEGRGTRTRGNAREQTRERGGKRKEDRRDGPRGAAGGRKAPGKPRRNQAPQLEEQDLSRLSFDERMALYKQKYNSRRPGTEDEKSRGRKTEAKPQGGHKHGDRIAGKGQANDSRRKGKKPHWKKDGETGQTPGTKERSEQTPEQAAPAKKGVFSRLLGVFKKGKKD